MSGKTWWKHQLYLGSTMRSLEQRAKCSICFAKGFGKGFGWRHHLSHTNPKHPLLDGYTTIPIDDTYTNTHKWYICPLHRKYMKIYNTHLLYTQPTSPCFSITHWLVERWVGERNSPVSSWWVRPRLPDTILTLGALKHMPQEIGDSAAMFQLGIGHRIGVEWLVFIIIIIIVLFHIH